MKLFLKLCFFLLPACLFAQDGLVFHYRSLLAVEKKGSTTSSYYLPFTNTSKFPVIIMAAKGSDPDFVCDYNKYPINPGQNDSIKICLTTQQVAAENLTRHYTIEYKVNGETKTAAIVFLRQLTDSDKAINIANHYQGFIEKTDSDKNLKIYRSEVSALTGKEDKGTITISRNDKEIKKIIFRESIGYSGGYGITTVYLDRGIPVAISKEYKEVIVAYLKAGGTEIIPHTTFADFYITDWQKNTYETVYFTQKYETLECNHAEIENILKLAKNPALAQVQNQVTTAK